MIIIAHRANLHGPSAEENTANAAYRALDAGFHVELDVRLNGRALWLGHDQPLVAVPAWLLKEKNIWWHAKTPETLVALLQLRLVSNCFFHESDAVTLTSHGWVWCYEGKPIEDAKAVHVVCDRRLDDVPVCHGICTDYPEHCRDTLNQNQV